MYIRESISIEETCSDTLYKKGWKSWKNAFNLCKLERNIEWIIYVLLFWKYVAHAVWSTAMRTSDATCRWLLSFTLHFKRATRMRSLFNRNICFCEWKQWHPNWFPQEFRTIVVMNHFLVPCQYLSYINRFLVPMHR